MFGSQGIAGGQNNLNIGQQLGLDPTGQGQAGPQDAMKLLQKLAQMLGIDGQTGAKEGGCQGCKGGGESGGASGASGAGGEGLEEMLRKLRELAQKNPGALQQALGQMPGLTQALSGALGAGGGAPGGGGMALG